LQSKEASEPNASRSPSTRFRRNYPPQPDELSLTILQDLFGFVGFCSLRRRSSRRMPYPHPVMTANSFIGRRLGSVASCAKLAAPIAR
jgi:hypothetical protein